MMVPFDPSSLAAVAVMVAGAFTKFPLKSVISTFGEVVNGLFAAAPAASRVTLTAEAAAGERLIAEVSSELKLEPTEKVNL